MNAARIKPLLTDSVSIPARVSDARRASSHHNHRARGGFTLLEVLLAMSILMLLVGSLYQFLKLTAQFEQGPSDAATAGQIVRGLSQKLQNDLNRLTAPTPLLVAGLSQIDSLSNPAGHASSLSSPPLSNGAEPNRSDTNHPRATQLLGGPHGFFLAIPTTENDWNVIAYRTSLSPAHVEFQWSHQNGTRTLSASLLPVSGGLIRDVSQLAGIETSPDLRPVSRSTADLDRRLSEGTAPTLSRVDVTDGLNIPEVRSLQCRYFDGREWRQNWDSAVERQLPVALELVLDCVGSDPHRIVLPVQLTGLSISRGEP